MANPNPSDRRGTLRPVPKPAPELSGRHTPVGLVMTPRVRTVSRRDSARHAANMMRDWHIQHLIVVDVVGRVCGVISDRDLRWATRSPAAPETRADPLEKLNVGQLMTVHPVTVLPSDDVKQALRKMREHKIGCLAVVDELGSAVGIVTGYDILTLALQLIDLVRTNA